MDYAEELSAIDIITYITEELQQSYRNKDVNKTKLFEDFFDRWEANDTSISKVKSLQFEFESG